MANPVLPEHVEISISEFNGKKTINYMYQDDASRKPTYVVNKNYADLSAAQKKVYDDFVKMVDSL